MPRGLFRRFGTQNKGKCLSPENEIPVCTVTTRRGNPGFIFRCVKFGEQHVKILFGPVFRYSSICNKRNSLVGEQVIGVVM